MVLENLDFHLFKEERMEFLKEFIKYLCELDLSQNPRKVSSDMYDNLETVDTDFDEKELKKNKVIVRSVKVKILELIKYYHKNADDCINKYSDKDCYEFLRELKVRAEEVLPYIMS